MMVGPMAWTLTRKAICWLQTGVQRSLRCSTRRGNSVGVSRVFLPLLAIFTSHPILEQCWSLTTTRTVYGALSGAAQAHRNLLGENRRRQKLHRRHECGARRVEKWSRFTLTQAHMLLVHKYIARLRWP